MRQNHIIEVVLMILIVVLARGQETSVFASLSKDETAESLAEEVRDKGWIVFCAKTGKGDWDLFLMRPDGSDRRQITNTRNYNEAGARFSPDGKRLLYYRLPGAEQIDNNRYGTYELVVADSNGGNAVVYGNRFKWASWGPDGRWFVGTANGLGVAWTIGRLNADTGRINTVSETDRYNCTPDWLSDSAGVVYSRGIVPDSAGWAQLWVAAGDGGERRLLYAEDTRHIYGGCVSPDGKYVLFTRSEEDLGKVDNSQTRMAIIRWDDTPVIGANSKSLRAEYPEARSSSESYTTIRLSWSTMSSRCIGVRWEQRPFTLAITIPSSPAARPQTNESRVSVGI